SKTEPKMKTKPQESATTTKQKGDTSNEVKKGTFLKSLDSRASFCLTSGCCLMYEVWHFWARNCGCVSYAPTSNSCRQGGDEPGRHSPPADSLGRRGSL